MIFKDDFFEKLPTDKFEAGILICRTICDFDKTRTEADKYKAFDFYIDAYGALEAFIQINELPYKIAHLETDKHKSIQSIMTFCYIMLSDLEKRVASQNLVTSRDKYISLFSSGFSYRLTDGDLSRIQ